jgi:hypothetical protein
MVFVISLSYSLMNCVIHHCLLHSDHTVLLRYTDSDYPFDYLETLLHTRCLVESVLLIYLVFLLCGMPNVSSVSLLSSLGFITFLSNILSMSVLDEECHRNALNYISASLSTMPMLRFELFQLCHGKIKSISVTKH